MATKVINLNPIYLRLLNILAILLCCLAAGFGVMRGIGTQLARYAPDLETAQFATTLVPSEPLPHLQIAALYEKTFFQEDFTKALGEYEKAVALRPQDYRLWLGLAKAYERNGDEANAEKAMRQALEFAPNYATVHWALGNQLLRQGNDEEAFIQIRKAVAQNGEFANQAVTTAWRIFDGDINQISQKIGDSVPIRASLVTFLVNQNRLDEAFAAWASIPDAEKTTTYRASGEAILGKLKEKKEYRKSLEMINGLYPDSGEIFKIGTVFNGDFERSVKTANAQIFDWQIPAGAQPQIGLDESQNRGGSKSLIVVYNSQTGQEFRQFSQLVAVESGKTYQFEAFYKSDLKTTGSFQWEIVNAADDKVIAATGLINPVSDWAVVNASFTVPENSQAVILRISPIKCKQNLCPTSGRIWFDDISLK